MSASRGRTPSRASHSFLEQSGAALVSGVPREETRGLMEKLIVPLIHFVLLGFLPLQRMRTSTDPRFAAACGQILAVRRAEYESAGGHSAIADRLHDAVALARTMREGGCKTDLFDATDTFNCRMYRSGSQVWSGFAKNAHEGLGSARLIAPATLLLLGGQVLPLVLLGLRAIAAGAHRYVRSLSSRASSQSRASANPFSALCCTRWAFAFSSRSSGSALIRTLRRRPAVWKGRCLLRCIRDMKIFLFLAILALHTTTFAAPVAKLSDFELTDQEAKPRRYRFPKAKVTVMTVADRKGSEQLAPWIQQLHDRYGARIDIDGLADVSMIAKPFHSIFRAAFRKQLAYPVMLDWDGSVVKQFGYAKGVANIYVIDRRGRILRQVTGPLSDEGLRDLTTRYRPGGGRNMSAPTSSKVWFITGCSSGLGRALARGALARGERVIATARKPEQLEATHH